jgi:H+-translocating NAD(P) transhydrogenase subunit beta
MSSHEGLISAAYVVAAVLFILALGGLSGQEKAKRAIWYGIIGMLLAVVATVSAAGGQWILMSIMIALGGIGGWSVANRVQMTQMPELMAGFHSLVGLAAVFIGINAHLELGVAKTAIELGNVAELTGFAATIAAKTPVEISILKVEMVLSLFIGAITFTGSLIAYGKLAERLSSSPLTLPGRHVLNLTAIVVCVWLGYLYFTGAGLWTLLLITVVAGALGCHLILGIGGADMPVVVSMLNSYSGWAAAAIGFTLSNDLLIVTGALVGSSGAILSYIMCKGMNRSFISVILGGWGGETESSASIGGEMREADVDSVARN